MPRISSQSFVSSYSLLARNFKHHQPHLFRLLSSSSSSSSSSPSLPSRPTFSTDTQIKPSSATEYKRSHPTTSDEMPSSGWTAINATILSPKATTLEDGGVKITDEYQDSQSIKRKKPPPRKQPKKNKKAKLREAEAHRNRSPSPAKNEKGRDPRTFPSRASGGVPDPSPEYLTLSSIPTTTLPSPRRILIIMDLNGTLLYRPNKHRPSHFVERPHARQFLDYCLSTFNLAIWSSARPSNVLNMVSQLLTRQQRDGCVTVWARDSFGLSVKDYDARVMCYKRLTRLWKDPHVAASHPAWEEGGRWDQTNTVLVDDSVEKGRSEPFNILPIPEFSGVENEKVDVLPQVHDYLNSLCLQTNISNYMKTNPFRLDDGYRLPAA